MSRSRSRTRTIPRVFAWPPTMTSPASLQGRSRRGDAAKTHGEALPTTLDAKGFSAVMDDEALAGRAHTNCAHAPIDARATSVRLNRRKTARRAVRTVAAAAANTTRRREADARPRAGIAWAQALPHDSRRQATSQLRAHDSAAWAAHHAGWKPARGRDRSRCRNASSCRRPRGGGWRSSGPAGPAASGSRRFAGRAEPCVSATPAPPRSVRARRGRPRRPRAHDDPREPPSSRQRRGRDLQWPAEGASVRHPSASSLPPGLHARTLGDVRDAAGQPPSGRWRRTIASPRLAACVRYRFRAVVPREAGYPYERGASHRVRVTVRGL